MDLGWRVDGKMREAWCPKCARKKHPELFDRKYQYLMETTNAHHRSAPSRVRRLPAKLERSSEEMREKRRIRRLKRKERQKLR